MKARVGIILAFAGGCAAHEPAAPATMPHAEVRVSSSPRTDPEAWRAVRPSTPPPLPIAPPAVESFTLPNGLQVHFVANHRLPLVAATLVVRAGYAGRSQPLADLVLASVARGPATLQADAFADRLAALGGTLTTQGDADFATVTVQALAEHWPETIALVADAALHPELGETRLGSLRKELTSQATTRAHINSSLAFDLVQHALYGDHPYGWTALSDPHAYERLSAREAKQLHEDRWQPDNCALIIVGDLTSEAARATAEQAFGAWKHGGKRTARPVPVPPPPGAAPPARIVIVDRPAAAQVSVVGGVRVAPRKSATWYPLVVANRILGGGFDSRLNMNLREGKGLSYGIRSRLEPALEAGFLYTSSSVRLEKAGEAVKEIIDEFDRLRLQPPGEAELKTAKESCRLGGALELETNRDIAGALADLVGLRLPTSELSARFAELEHVGVADVEAVATQFLTSQRMTMVIVGPAALLREQLQRVGLSAVDATPPR